MLPSLESSLTVIKYCPPLTSATRAKYKPLLAVGTNSGNLAIFNLATGLMLKEYHVHSHPVRLVRNVICISTFIDYTKLTMILYILPEVLNGLVNDT